MSYQNSETKKLFKGFILITALVIFFDYSIGALLKYYYFKQKSGFLFLTTYVLDSAKADCLVFGSSRADHHYVPSIFAAKLHTSFFNCGSSGTRLIYSAAAVDAVLERYTPKMVIIDLRPDDFSLSEEGTLSVLLPYHDNPAIYPFLKYNSKFEYFKLLSKIYPYNSMLTNIIAGNLSFNKARSSNDRGYLTLKNVLPYHKRTLFINDSVMIERIKVFDVMLKKLNQKNVPVFVVISPFYYKIPSNDIVAATAENICGKYKNIWFFNYENNPDFDNNKLFSDEKHMNDAGARKFSADLAEKMLLDK